MVSPIVVLLKNDGSVRVFADFSMGMNSKIDIYQYSLPRHDELFSILFGGNKFSDIDLASPYLKMEVEQKSRPFLTINTHRGLYRFNRLPFGLSSASSLWQKAMNETLSGISHVTYYLDDIIVTGKTGEDRLRNLYIVLDGLKSA